MQTLFLIGPRGSGKTTIGSIVAYRLGLPLQDTDVIIREEAGCSIADIVAGGGWPAFRAKETAALALAAQRGGVIATGGGAVLAPENRSLMRRSGTVFYLEVPLEALTARLTRNLAAQDRPSLTGQGSVQELAVVLAERAPLYRETAHHVIPANRRPEFVAKHIEKILGSFPGGQASPVFVEAPSDEQSAANHKKDTP